jgi:hypothetical protein
MWHNIPLDLARFLGEFGVCVEDEGNNSYSFKYCIFPSKFVMKKCQFSETETFFTDKFYDRIENGVLKPTLNFFFRERSNDGIIKFIEQEAMDILSSCHVYSERELDSIPVGLENFLTINYNRRSLIENGKINENNYLDSMFLPPLQTNYEVISIRVKVEESDNVREKLFELFSLAYDINRDNLQFEQENDDSLLENENYPIFPMYSKFMYALQMSIYFESYREYCKIDPNKTSIRIRTSVARDPDNFQNKCYDRLWLWLVDYQPHYFKTRLHNCKDKSKYIDEVLQIVEENRAILFRDESIQLFEEDYLYYELTENSTGQSSNEPTT